MSHIDVEAIELVTL